MDRVTVERWMNDYERLWRTPGTGGLGEIFSDDVRYAPSPWGRPVLGLAALAEFWEAERDGPDEAFALTSEVVAVERERAVVRTSVEYADGQWRNLWVLEFGGDGRCSHFEEWPFAPDQPDGHD
jgi:hypothetical protein